MRRYGIAAGVLVLVILGVFVGRQLALTLSASDAPGHTFRIAGSAAGLVPGNAVPLRVTVSNPNAQPIRVTSIEATARAAARDCSAGLITVAKFAGAPQTIVPGRGQADITLTITLSAQASDACRRVSFPLSFTGRAEQWK